MPGTWSTHCQNQHAQGKTYADAIDMGRRFCWIFCLDTPLCDVLFLSRRCCAANKKHPFGPDQFQKICWQRQSARPSLLLRNVVYSAHYQSILSKRCILKPTLRHEGQSMNITFRITASPQANAMACSRNCTTVPNLTTTDDTTATLQNTSSCATVLGAEWRKSATQKHPRKAVLFFAQAYLTIMIASSARLPGTHSLGLTCTARLASSRKVSSNIDASCVSECWFFAYGGR